MTTPFAENQLREAVWWAKHRSMTAQGLVDDVRRAVTLLTRSPHLGAVATEIPHANVKRLYLHAIRYYIYYRVAADEVQILSFLPESWVDHPPG